MQLLILFLGGVLVISKQWTLKQVISRVYSIQSIEHTQSGKLDTTFPQGYTTYRQSLMEHSLW